MQTKEYIQFYRQSDGAVVYIEKNDKEAIKQYRESGEYYEYCELSF